MLLRKDGSADVPEGIMVAGKRMTKAQTMSELAEKTGLTKKEIVGVFDALQDLVKKEHAHSMKKGEGYSRLKTRTA